MTEAITAAAVPAPPPDPGRQSPGEYLRKLREEKGHTYAAVGAALHLTVHYIKALEGDEYGKLPGLTFVKGYLRAYARFLGADVDSVLGRFDEHITGLLDAGQHTARVERSKRRQDQALRWGIGAGCVVVAGLLAGWWFMSGRDTAPEAAPVAAPVERVAAASPPPAGTAASAARTPIINMPAFAANAPAVQQPLPAQIPTLTNQAPVTTGLAGAGAPTTVIPTAISATLPAASTAAAGNLPIITPTANGGRQVSLIGAGNDELKVTFIGSSWIEVDDGSLVRLYNDMLSAGDTLTIRGAAPFHVLLGDASQVQVSLNAAAVDISADIRADSTARLVLGAPASTGVTQ
jgi:cytoskeleton protein RodZ